MPFGGLSDVRLKEGLKRDKVDELYEILSKEFHKNQDAIYYDDFVVSRGELCFDGRENEPLAIKGHLRPIDTLKRVLGKSRIYVEKFSREVVEKSREICGNHHKISVICPSCW